MLSSLRRIGAGSRTEPVPYGERVRTAPRRRRPVMKVGIVGGGAAGLATASLLDGHHRGPAPRTRDATRRPRHHGRHRGRTGAGSGWMPDSQFFSSGPTYASFNRLLDVLGVAREAFDATLTVYDIRARIRSRCRRSRPPRPPVVSHRRRCARSSVPRGPRDLPRSSRGGHHDHDRRYLEAARLPAVVAALLLPRSSRSRRIDRAGSIGVRGLHALYYLGANATSGLRAPVAERDPRRHAGLRRRDRRLARARRGPAAVPRPCASSGRRRFAGRRMPRASPRVDRARARRNPRRAQRSRAISGSSSPSFARSRGSTFETTIAIHGDLG